MVINIPCNERCWGDFVLKIEYKNKNKKTIKSSDSKKLCLRVRFEENYPLIPPFLHLYYQNFEEFLNDDLKFLQNIIDQKAQNLCKLKQPMIYEISLFLEEEYQKLKEIITFYENMEKEQEERKSKPIKNIILLKCKILKDETMNEDFDEIQDEKVYEERYKKDIEGQLKMKIISGGTPLMERKTQGVFFIKEDEDFELEGDCAFYEIADKKERFITDFTELKKIANKQKKSVIKAENKLDKNVYLIKRLQVNQNSLEIWEKHLKKLMSLHHENLIRYYQGWTEEEINESEPLTKNNEKSDDELDISFRDNENNAENISQWSEEDDVFLNSPDEKYLIKTEPSTEKTKILYIQMEYCKELTLFSAIKHNLLKERNLKKKIISQLAYVLNYIHEQKMIHRSIKPSNIFLDKNMNLKLGDFGDPIQEQCIKLFDKNNGGNAFDHKNCELSEKFTQKTDMYFFGKIIFQIWYDFESDRQRKEIFFDIKNDHVLKLENSIKISKDNIFELIKKLLCSNPNLRPEAKEIPKFLEDFFFSKDIQSYPNIFIKKKLIPFLFSSKNIEIKTFENEKNVLLQKFPHNLKFLNYLENKIEKIFVKTNAEKFEIYHQIPFIDKTLIYMAYLEGYLEKNEKEEKNLKKEEKNWMKEEKLAFHKFHFIRQKNDEYMVNNLFVNNKGVLLENPNELLSNFSSFISANKIAYKKRYCFHTMNYSPFQIIASYDLVYSRKLLTQNLDYTETLNMFDSEINLEIANEAEAISVAYESMKQILPNENDIEICICHSGIMDIIISECGMSSIQTEFLIQNLSLLNQMKENDFFSFCLNKSSFNTFQLAKLLAFLKNKEVFKFGDEKNDEEKINGEEKKNCEEKKQEEKKYEKANESGDDKKFIESEKKHGKNEIAKFEEKLNKKNKVLFKLIKDQLESLCIFLEKFNIPKNIIHLNFFLLSMNPSIYYSGLIFSVSVKKFEKNLKKNKNKKEFSDFIIFGGRYDNLIENYERFQNKQHEFFVGINFQIFLNKIVSLINNWQKNPKKEADFDFKAMILLQNFQKNLKEEYAYDPIFSKYLLSLQKLFKEENVYDLGIQISSGELMKEKIKLVSQLRDLGIKINYLESRQQKSEQNLEKIRVFIKKDPNNLIKIEIKENDKNKISTYDTLENAIEFIKKTLKK